MAPHRISPRERVRDRSRGRCEKCGVKLLRNRWDDNNQLRGRTIHHRKPRRAEGKDSVVNMVHLCNRCHHWIHANERDAALGGWLVTRDPASTPFEGPTGWLLPLTDGSWSALDFEVGRLLPRTPARTRRRVAYRPHHRERSWVA